MAIISLTDGKPLGTNIDSASGGEHISLESDTVDIFSLALSSKPLAKYQLKSWARGSQIRVVLLQGHFASINTKRARGSEKEHAVNLRFVDSRPVGIRKIAWPWIYVALSLAALATTASAYASLFASPQQLLWTIPTAILLGTCAVSSALIALYFTTESLVFLSLHGRARLIVITGGLGTCRAARKCALDIVKHINLSRQPPQPTKQVSLRDEMREHSRLHEEGVLSDEQYENAKLRILQAHG